jgi:hypothetical protein
MGKLRNVKKAVLAHGLAGGGAGVRGGGKRAGPGPACWHEDLVLVRLSGSRGAGLQRPWLAECCERF